MTTEERTTPAARLVRGWLGAALATFLAGASHAVAGGSIPFAAAALALAVSALMCVLLAGRRLSGPRIILGVVMSQLSFHALFELFSAAPTLSTNSLGVHQHEVAIALLPSATTALAGSGMTLLMAFSHLCAGLLTVFLIRRGEGLWWSLMGILTAGLVVIARVVGPHPVADPRRARPTAEPAAALYELLHRDTRLKLRGPPPWEPSLP